MHLQFPATRYDCIFKVAGNANQLIRLYPVPLRTINPRDGIGRTTQEPGEAQLCRAIPAGTRRNPQGSSLFLAAFLIVGFVFALHHLVVRLADD